jgi:hypothetical protein
MSTNAPTTEYGLVRISPPSVLLEDAPTHHPPYFFCSDESCPCHHEGVWLDHVANEYTDGLLTLDESVRIIFHQQINS